MKSQKLSEVKNNLPKSTELVDGILRFVWLSTPRSGYRHEQDGQSDSNLGSDFLVA